ncbi:MAG: TIGR03620 family F420-dependent LLM class oxidoreductase [Kitasatospora sp.]|nr:TIGR03620 family F420-dependent LLM class oxidoreductase [Kitasatospora sp.]
MVITALAFDFTNGFHDTGNAMATSIATGALPPRVAVAVSGLLNFVGAFLSLAVAATIANGLVNTGDVTLTVVAAGLCGGIIWNLLTWLLGIPSSSSHALIGGVIGATMAAAGGSAVQWHGLVSKVIIPAAFSPVIAALVAATGILNVWNSDPGETAAADAALRADFPGRFMLGIGIGHREATSEYRRPLTTMHAFLDGLDASPSPPSAGERCLAALGPKMVDLAAERTAGTHPYFVPVEHTRWARGRLGPGKLVAPEVACVVDTDPVRAKAVARRYARLYLGMRNYTQNLLRFGFTEDDLAGGGSDRLIDAIIPQGSAGQIAEVVRAHLDAGADHVCLQPLGEEGIPRRSWTALAQALAD